MHSQTWLYTQTYGRHKFAHILHLPRGISTSSFLQRSVGGGSPWTWHLNSTLSSTKTTWFTGRCTNTGLSGCGSTHNMVAKYTSDRVVNSVCSKHMRKKRHALLLFEPGYECVSDFLPNTESWAFSLSLSPTMLAATHTYIPASSFLVFEIVSFPPRNWQNITLNIAAQYKVVSIIFLREFKRQRSGPLDSYSPKSCHLWDQDESCLSSKTWLVRDAHVEADTQDWQFLRLPPPYPVGSAWNHRAIL